MVSNALEPRSRLAQGEGAGCGGATPDFVDHVTLAIDWFHCQSGLPRRMSVYRLTDLAELVKQYMGS